MSVPRFAIAALVLLTLAAVPAGAQQGIRWGLNVSKGIAQAKKVKRPLMFWVLSSKSRRDDDVERDQRRAFADERVVNLSKRFVPVRLSRSQNPGLIKDWGLPRSTNLTIVFVTPSGEKIDLIGPTGVANAQSLAQKMSLVFRAYRRKLFSEQIQPKLVDPKTSLADLKTGLKWISEFTILDADKTIVTLLERPKLDASVRKGCLNILAQLSTRPAVDALVGLAAENDADAIKTLAKCTPLGAEYMLDQLDLENADLFVPIYQAVTKITRIKRPKPLGFWNGKNERIKNEEIQRVRKHVQIVARRWRARYEDYR